MLLRSRLCVHLSWKILIGKSEMPKTCGWENFRVREKEGPVKDFRETVYEGVKPIHMAKERIVWWTFCKRDKNLQLSQTGCLIHLWKISNPDDSKFSNIWTRHSQTSVISVTTIDCVKFGEMFTRCNPFHMLYLLCPTKGTSIKLYKTPALQLLHFMDV